VKHRRSIFIAVAIAFTFIIPCKAQELDLFELTDFVDPRLRGAEVSPELVVTDKGGDFRFFRAIVGGVANYNSRTRPTGGDVAFVHLAGSIYSGMQQFNYKVTTLKANDDASRPRLRVTGQYARYGFSHLEDSTTHEKSLTTDRYLLTASLEDTEKCKPIVSALAEFPAGTGSRLNCSRHLDSEFGIQSDSSLLGADRDLVTFLFGMRNTADDGLLLRSTISIRVFERTSSKARMSLAIDHSLERANNSVRVGATGLAIGTSFDLRKGMTVHGLWRPSYVPSEPGHRVYNEFGLFIDTTLYSRLLPRLAGH
jgi:hypothetical protein